MKTLILILLFAVSTFGQHHGKFWTLDVLMGSDAPSANRMIVRTSEGHIMRTSETKTVTVINNLMVYNNEKANENYRFDYFAMLIEFIKPKLSGLNTDRYAITKYINKG